MTKSSKRSIEVAFIKCSTFQDFIVENYEKQNDDLRFSLKLMAILQKTTCNFLTISQSLIVLVRYFPFLVYNWGCIFSFFFYNQRSLNKTNLYYSGFFTSLFFSLVFFFILLPFADKKNGWCWTKTRGK